jgi:hypothetical protein
LVRGYLILDSALFAAEDDVGHGLRTRQTADMRG